MRLNEHPLRRQVVGEMHLRRWPRLAPPAQILQVLRIVAPQDRAAERAMLDDLPLNGHLAPSDNARHAEGELGPGLSFAWEQHSEACGITLFVRDPAVDVAPALAWIERFPGEVIRATRIHLVATEAEAEALLPDLDFVGSDLVSCHIGAASLEPVSYTHLDVYKRQPLRSGESGPVSVQHIVRSFDPCMVCTVH